MLVKINIIYIITLKKIVNCDIYKRINNRSRHEEY